MYQACNNGEDDFEPRATPKPASKFDCFSLPSVPEVSLIFDKPLSCKAVDYKGFRSPSVEPRPSKHKNNVLSPLNTNGSYAAWKEQNYSYKPSTSKVNDCPTPPKIQYNQNYNAEFYASENAPKDDRLLKNNDETLDSSNYVRVPHSTKRHPYQYEPAKNTEMDNCNNNENVNQTELILTETQSRPTFMEQKVSIGVMTSFEFTVQNSPFSVDIEDYERNESQSEKGNLKISNNVGVRDTDVNHEPLRRYKNSFNRIPSAQLENIVEDSESYMSSSQQQSSNLNASISLKDLEKQAYIDARRDVDTCRSESPKQCKGATVKMNHIQNTQKHLERSNKEETTNYVIVETPMPQKNTVEYNSLGKSNRKINIPSSTDQYNKLHTHRDNESATASNSVNRSTDYYENYRKEGQVAAKRGSCIEDSMILNGGDLKINERPPTPEPSIHVEMQEYSSDDDSEKVKRSSKVGWTFYNNVLGQVNQLLQNSCVTDDQQQDQRKVNQNNRDETENRALDSVKVATLEQLKKLGISLSENPEHKESNNSNKTTFDSSFYPRLDYQANMTQATSAVNETNTSMHMKALALKYLTDEQLSELAVQRQGSASVKHLMLSNVQGTNMSFATMRYLERYQLLPGKNNVQTEDTGKVQAEVFPKGDMKFTNAKKGPTLQRFPFTQTPRTTCPSKILDISTLKQQPKLL
ncbi:SCL-interrupting locus protein like protein [Dufourea novaeangliae]|uniref:SCL-interrupting locus protein like protein n=1 Tax=Dufourea novaeangliae TaxID=178035 RepID=A0A154PDT0_DUFNO|nr:SCL-interrupting locus protein like protein [Dufourea novaeangliae]